MKLTNANVLNNVTEFFLIPLFQRGAFPSIKKGSMGVLSLFSKEGLEHAPACIKHGETL